MDLIYKKQINRQLNRLNEQRDKLIKEHRGKENEFTYWGGYSLGYLDGKITQIENTIEKIEESELTTKNPNSGNTVNSYFDSMVTNLSTIQIECGRQNISVEDFNNISDMITNLKEYVINSVSYEKK